MVQLIAICFLVSWAGFGVYLYRIDYESTKYWNPSKIGFWVDISLRSFGFTLGASVASVIVFALVGTAVGYIR